MTNELRISGVQANLHWEDKVANLQMLGDRILAMDQTTEIVVLPEMFSTGFSMKPEMLAESMEGPTVTWMKDLSNKRKVILTGSVIIEDKGHYFNRAVWMLPNGQHAFYDKRHLFAYGDEDEHYTAGEKRLIVSVNGWRINLLVCYDLRFPVWARQNEQLLLSDGGGEQADFEYDVLIYVANWPEKRIHAWKTLLMSRAIENQCYVVGINRVGDDGKNIHYSGDSMIVGPMGEVVYGAGAKEDAFTVSLSKTHLEEIRRQYPFWRDKDNFRLLT